MEKNKKYYKRGRDNRQYKVIMWNFKVTHHYFKMLGKTYKKRTILI